MTVCRISLPFNLDHGQLTSVKVTPPGRDGAMGLAAFPSSSILVFLIFYDLLNAIECKLEADNMTE